MNIAVILGIGVYLCVCTLAIISGVNMLKNCDSGWERVVGGCWCFIAVCLFLGMFGIGFSAFSQI